MHEKEKELVSFPKSAWESKDAFSGFIESTESRAALDFFFKENRAIDRVGIDNTFMKREGMLKGKFNYQWDVEYQMANNDVGYPMLWDKFTFNLAYYPEQVETEFYFPRKMVIDHVLEHGRDLTDLKRGDARNYLPSFPVAEDPGLFKAMIDMPGSLEIILNKRDLPADLYDFVWKQPDEIENYLIPIIEEGNASQYDIIKDSWVERTSDEVDKEGSHFTDIDQEGAKVFAGIDNDMIAAGIIDKVAETYSINGGIGALGLKPTRKQRKKYENLLVDFFTDLAINGTETARKQLLESIGWRSTYRHDRYFGTKNACKIIDEIGSHSREEEILKHVNEAREICKKRKR